MKLTTKQKDIVKNIINGNITDIYSFVKHYNLGEELCYSKIAVEDAFHKEYDNKTFLVKIKEFEASDDTDRIVEKIDEKTGYAKAELFYEYDYVTFSGCNINYTYNLFDPLYSTENIKDIISFIALWQYLKEQGLIMELPKTCSPEDMGLFARKCKEISHFVHPRKNNSYSYSQLFIPSYAFIDDSYELDKENFEICFPYLTKKLYPAPELTTFMQKGFNTKEERNERRNFLIALAGVLIALITSVASIIISLSGTDYHKDLDTIRDSIESLSDSKAAKNSNP